MTDQALKTLFLPFETGALTAKDRAVFFGAQDHPALKAFQGVDAIQHWAGPADILKAKGYEVYTDLPAGQVYGMVLCLPPKQKEAAKGMLGRAALALEEDGVLVAAAANDAGGNRLEKWFKELGFDPHSLSKNKARVVWASGYFNKEKAQSWSDGAAPRNIELDGQTWWTRPGIFGWDKIDTGSELLTHYIPDDLKGDVADFGCGYGYLSRFILEICPNIKSLTAIDADAHALEMCRKNVPQAKCVHIDLTSENQLQTFDVIIMNPPFHDRKKAESDLGLFFIETAHAHLKPKGALYMVANAHLPYEKTLQGMFASVEKLNESKGFKTFKAMK